MVLDLKLEDLDGVWLNSHLGERYRFLGLVLPTRIGDKTMVFESIKSGIQARFSVHHFNKYFSKEK